MEIDIGNLIIVATGLLHDGASLQPEKTWRSLNAAALMRSFVVNAIGPALVAKHTLPLFPREDRAIFAALSARVGSISDNRSGGWYGYRASKAALNQLIRTMSIELASKRKQAICVGLHPGTVADSQLSTPDLAACRLLSVINQLKPGDTGRLIAWDGTTVAA
jgi:NAD(P)-dependent dehydrogenase (short-subunit alcohol dehydrogenase family)